LVGSAAEAVRAASTIGYPVVAKICSADILHKSDGGFVKVGLRNGAEVRAAYRDFMDRAPEADGVLICEQVADGVECVVGVATDELFGPVVMVGLGGVLVEVIGDVSFRVPPFSRHDAVAMIEELKGAALLHGVRGRPAADRAALVDVLMKVQRLATDLASEVVELDINPLVVHGKGAVALDALVVPR
jgi:acyl-CoA synthetase (NDP forming)